MFVGCSPYQRDHDTGVCKTNGVFVVVCGSKTNGIKTINNNKNTVYFANTGMIVASAMLVRLFAWQSELRVALYVDFCLDSFCCQGLLFVVFVCCLLWCVVFCCCLLFVVVLSFFHCLLFVVVCCYRCLSLFVVIVVCLLFVVILILLLLSGSIAD